MISYGDIRQIVNDIEKLIGKSKDKELNQKVDELIEKTSVLIKENSELQQDKIVLESKLRTQNDLEFNNNSHVYYSKDENDTVPYCPNCYEKSGKTLEVHLGKNTYNMKNPNHKSAICPNCERTYDVKVD